MAVLAAAVCWLAGPARCRAAVPDSSAALLVETLPGGLLVFLNGEPAGRSPLSRAGLPPGILRVRVLRDDPRRFDRAGDEAAVTLRAGEPSRVVFDLRPPVVLETRPGGAAALLRGAAGPGDSLLGDTPLSLPQALFEGRFFSFRHRCCRDTTIAGRLLLDVAAARGTAALELTPLSPPRVESVRGRPLWKRRWVKWGLVGIGAGLTGASALWKREADRWYDRYLDSSDRRVLEGYYDRAARYDRLSLASLAVGQTLFTSGVVLLVSHGLR